MVLTGVWPVGPWAPNHRWFNLGKATLIQGITSAMSVWQSTREYPIPSGKRLHNYGKSRCSMGKSTISMAIFNSYVTNYQRVPVLEKKKRVIYPMFWSIPHSSQSLSQISRKNSSGQPILVLKLGAAWPLSWQGYRMGPRSDVCWFINHNKTPMN